MLVDLPAYAGWGPTGIPPEPPPRRTSLREAALEARHGPLNPRTMMHADGTDHLVALHRNAMGPPTVFEAEAVQRDMRRREEEAAFRRAQDKAARAAEQGRHDAYVAAEEYAAVAVTFAMRYNALPPSGAASLVLQTPHGAVRLAIEPTPEEVER